MRAINDGQKTLSAIKEEMIKVRCSPPWCPAYPLRGTLADSGA